MIECILLPADNHSARASLPIKPRSAPQSDAFRGSATRDSADPRWRPKVKSCGCVGLVTVELPQRTTSAFAYRSRSPLVFITNYIHLVCPAHAAMQHEETVASAEQTDGDVCTSRPVSKPTVRGPPAWKEMLILLPHLLL